MGAPRIKRDHRKFERNTRRMFETGRVATVSIIQHIQTKEVLSVGVDHSAAFLGLPKDTPEGSWEVKEVRVWR